MNRKPALLAGIENALHTDKQIKHITSNILFLLPDHFILCIIIFKHTQKSIQLRTSSTKTTQKWQQDMISCFMQVVIALHLPLLGGRSSSFNRTSVLWKWLDCLILVLHKVPTTLRDNTTLSLEISHIV